MKYLRRLISIFLFSILCLMGIDLYSIRAEEGAGVPQEQEAEEKVGLLLAECIQYAAYNSFEVKLARLDFLIAETGQSAAEAIFDATLSADIGYSKDRKQQLSAFGAQKTTTNIYSIGASKKLPTGTELELTFSDTRESTDSRYVSISPSHTAQATIEARQPLAKNIFGYVDRRSISLISLAIQNADLDKKERIETLFADVEKAYWEWTFSKEALKIYQDILEKAKELHKANARNYDTGLMEKGDFLASEANVLIREKDVLIAENKYRHAEEYIKLLMNIDASERIYPKEALEYKKMEVDLDDCLSQAFQKRRDYQQVKREVKRKNIVLETKANERWPEIDLVASMTANGIESRFSKAANKIISEDNTEYFAGVEISIPLENNLARSEHKKAKANKEKAILTLKKLERTILTKIGGVFLDYVTYEANVDKLTKAATLQKEKLEEEGKRFNYGRSNTKRLIDYQQDYLLAELQLALGLLDLELARVNLEKALNAILGKYEAML